MDELMAASYAYARASRRYTVLSELLTILEGIRRSFSRNEANQVAKEGFEKAFDEEGRRVETIREMMRELRIEIESRAKEIETLRKE